MPTTNFSGLTVYPLLDTGGNFIQDTLSVVPGAAAAASLSLLSGTGSLAAYMIIPTTGFSIRNNANNSTLWNITNAGVVTQSGGGGSSAGQVLYTLTRTVTSGASADLTGLSVLATTITVTGGTHVTLVQGLVNIAAPTLTDSSAVTIDGYATLNVAGPPVAAGSVTLTNAYGLRVASGDVLFGGNLIFSAASARIIPGATSLLFQNNANNASNLTITDAGLVSVVRGNLAVTAGNLVFAAASAKIVPGATSLLLQNHADNATNLTIVDAGTATFRAGVLSIGPSGGVGYATGAGGASTQGTNKSTTTVAVPNPSMCGSITMNNATLNANTAVSFTFTNTAITPTDVLVLNHISGGTVGAYVMTASAGSGSAVITVTNITAGNLSEAVVIQYAIIKGVNS